MRGQNTPRGGQSLSLAQSSCVCILAQSSSLARNARVSWLWTIVDWGEDYDGIVTACVSLVGSSVLKKAPQELEQRALQFTEEVDQKSMPAASWSRIKEMRRQLTARVHKGTGLLTPDVWRIWFSVYAPGTCTALVLLQVHAVGAVRPLVFKVPGVTVQRYAGALMTDSHFVELQCSAQMSEAEAWLEALPMFVPTLWCFDPKIVCEVVGSKFGCGPCGSAVCGAWASLNV